MAIDLGPDGLTLGSTTVNDWDDVSSSTTLGDIGTYSQVYNSKFVNGVQYNLGETCSGSEFRKKNSNTAYGGNYGTGNVSFMLYGNSTSAGLTGTWRCMSNDCISTGNEANNRAMYPALWVRVS